MMQDIDVSVIIPTYRRPAMLQEAIQSVLMQQKCAVEIIVVDDHSDDDTASVVTRFPNVRYFENEKNCGPGYSRKFGFSVCSGRYVVFMDDDDYYTDPLFFRKALNELDSDHYAFLSANAQILEPNGAFTDSPLNTTGVMAATDYLSGFAKKYKKPHSTFTTVFSKSHLQNVGLMEMQMVNDVAIYMRALISGNVFFLSDTIGVYRVHENNISSRITGKFLIANLEEKHAIYHIIKEKELFPDALQWWEQQIESTVSYYVYGSTPPLSDFKQVRKWCLTHTEQSNVIKETVKQYHAYLLDCKICKIKSSIKKGLGMK